MLSHFNLYLCLHSISNINENKFQILKGRDVVLFPDLKALNNWKEKVAQFKANDNIKVVDFFEKIATALHPPKPEDDFKHL